MILPWYMSNSYIQYFVKTKYTRDIRLNGHVEWSTVVKDDQTNATVNNTRSETCMCDGDSVHMDCSDWMSTAICWLIQHTSLHGSLESLGVCLYYPIQPFIFMVIRVHVYKQTAAYLIHCAVCPDPSLRICVMLDSLCFGWLSILYIV